MMLPSLLPIYAYDTGELIDGTMIPACSLCRKKMAEHSTACHDHYMNLRKKDYGYYPCPFGFTSRTWSFDGKTFATTGVVGYPRFDTAAERSVAKRFPQNKVTREHVESVVRSYEYLDRLRAEYIESAAKVLPQAFHELRKLNGAIIQHAEKEMKQISSPALQAIKSAAELMRNNFDILEALSNIEGMRALPLDDTINVYDLAYKTKMVFRERAFLKNINVSISGTRAIVPGSQKSFPIVPAVLIENAIKYGQPQSTISVNISTGKKTAYLRVSNESEHEIDVEKCFERGTRYAANLAEGGGFGLFLAREIVEAHAGTIRCETSEGGVVFTVELPLVKVVPSNF